MDPAPKHSWQKLQAAPACNAACYKESPAMEPTRFSAPLASTLTAPTRPLSSGSRGPKASSSRTMSTLLRGKASLQQQEYDAQAQCYRNVLCCSLCTACTKHEGMCLSACGTLPANWQISRCLYYIMAFQLPGFSRALTHSLTLMVTLLGSYASPI